MRSATTGRRPRARVCLLVAAALLAGTGCRRGQPAAPAPAPAPIVDAQAHRAFWLWAGVRPQPVLEQAEALYLLQGEVLARDPSRVAVRRGDVPRVRHAAVWIVYRVETLAWGDAVYAALNADIAQWRRRGNAVRGVQIDFDARTRQLDRYATFLRGLRARLPADCRLSITGLLDWSANGDPRQLDALAGVVDEAVLQIYQGRRVIPGYARYFRNIADLRLPFKIGLLQGGPWQPPAGVESHPQFKGYVVFLVNPPATAAAGPR